MKSATLSSALYLQEEGVAPATVTDLVNGQTLRGVADAALKELGMPVSVMAAPETSPAHQPHTAHRLAALTRATMLGTHPEPLALNFPEHKKDCVDTLLKWISVNSE